MKRFLFAVLVLLSVQVFGQYPAGYTGINNRYDWIAGKFRALHAPAGIAPALSSGQWTGAGALFVDTTGGGKGLWVYYDGAWKHLLDSVTAVSLTPSISNIGSSYRLWAPNTPGLKTMANAYGISLDTSTSNTLTVRADTSVGAGLIGWSRLNKTKDSLAALGWGLRDRFGLSGEDDVAGEDRVFDLDNSWAWKTKANNDNYISYNGSSWRFDYLGTDGSYITQATLRPDLGLFIRSQSAPNQYAQITAAEDISELELITPAGTTGLLNRYSSGQAFSLLAVANPYVGYYNGSENNGVVYIGRARAVNGYQGIEGLRMYRDSISMQPPLGNFYIDSLDRATDTTGFDVLVKNRTTGKIEILYSSLSGGGGGGGGSWGSITGTLSDQTDLQTALDGKVNNTGNETIAGTKTFSSDPIVPAEAYDATSWNGSNEVPTKDAIRDKIESMGGGSGTVNTGAANKAAYYPSGGTTVDDFTGLELNTGSNPTVKIIGQTAGQNNLQIVEAASQSVYPFAIYRSDGTTLEFGVQQNEGVFMRKYGQIIGTDLQWGNTQEDSYFNIKANSSHGVRFRDNGGNNIIQSNFSSGAVKLVVNQTQASSIMLNLQQVATPTVDALRITNSSSSVIWSINSAGKLSKYNNAAPTDGQVLIGHTSNGTFEAATLTEGAGISITNAGGSVTIASSNVESTYTPTLTNTTNVAASTAYVTRYTRIGDMIHVWGEVSIDATTALTISELGLSLPVASTIAATQDLAGTGSFEDNTTVQIKGDVSNGRATLRFTPQSATNNRYSFHFTYKYVAP